MDLIAKMEEQIEKFSLLKFGERVLLGVSGGADSMCLLEAMCLLRERYALELFVVHVHHGIRGSEADEDAAFVQRECETRSVTCQVVRELVPDLAAKEGCSLEEAGRLARYRAFERAAEKWRCNRIAVAHNLEDQAETMLFHAFRGSGLRGMAGMPVCRDKIIRPLLAVSRMEIEAFLTERKVMWRTDATNLTEEYTRNRIRHQILPAAIEGVNSKATEHLAELAQDLARVTEYLQQEADIWYQRALLSIEAAKEEGGSRCHLSKDETMSEAVQPQCFSTVILQEVPGVLREQLWWLVWKRLTGRAEDFGRVHILALEELLEGGTGRSLSLPYGIVAEKSYDSLYFRKKVLDSKAVTPAPFVRKITEFPCSVSMGEWELHLSVRAATDEKKDEIPKNNYTKWFDYGKIGDILTLRGRMPGDYIVIHKDGRKKPLKSILIDRKVPRAEREQLFVLAAGSRVLWCVGIRAEEGLYVDENTKHILVAELKKKG